MLRTAIIWALLLASVLPAASELAAAEPVRSAAEVEELLLGTWRGGPCGGSLRFSKDGTFHRRGYSPGNNEIAGTWLLRWDSLPPTLVLTNKTSDDPKSFPPGKMLEVKIVGLSNETLDYAYSENDHTKYVRMKPREAAAAEVRELVVAAKITQAIGTFSSYGIPHAGDSFELDLGDLPKESIQMKRAGNREGPSYIPYRGPLVVERVESGSSVLGKGRIGIYLQTDEVGSSLRIRIIADGREPGSKVRITMYEEGGFIGSMAEAEGVIK